MKFGRRSSSSGYVLSDPPEFGPRDQLDGTEAGHAWNNLTRPISPLLALAWYEDFDHRPFLNWVQDARDFTVEGAQSLDQDLPAWNLADREVLPALACSAEDLGESQPLVGSMLADLILETLQGMGVTGTPISLVPAGSYILDIEVPFTWQGSWATGFGTRCNVCFEVRRSADGVERAVIYTNLLVSTRSVETSIVRECLDSVVVGLPCQTLLYLSETPFPSALWQALLRDTHLQGVAPVRRPMPMAWLEEFALCATQLGDASEDEVHVDFATYPLVIKLGYNVGYMPPSEMAECLTFAINTLVAAATTVEDGFRNARNIDSMASFDQVFLSEYDLFSREIGEVDGFARWIPEPLLGSLLSHTADLYALQLKGTGNAAEQRAALQWIADFGAGRAAASGINTLAYSHLLPEDDFEKASFYLLRATRMGILEESTNAMTNYGALFIKAGLLAEAKVWLEEALAQPDQFSEGEASLLLARIFREEGDEAQAVDFYRRAIDSSDSHFAAVAQEELAESAMPAATRAQAPVANSVLTRAKFCPECGTPLEEHHKFCTGCGSATPEPLVDSRGQRTAEAPTQSSSTLGTVPEPEPSMGSGLTRSSLHSDLAAPGVGSLDNGLREALDPSTPSKRLVELVSNVCADISSAATQTIFDIMDTTAMTLCGDAASAVGNLERAEFWFMEVATADADETVRADGIENLARRVLLPAGRLYEAELYTRNAALKADARSRVRADRTLADIKNMLIARGPDGLEFDDRWRHVDISGPARIGSTQQELYRRMIAYTFYMDSVGELDGLIAGLQSDFMQCITGYLIGLAETSSELGMERETAVKATADWLAHRDGSRFP
jgi:tetratricopeptide (TPR) repeat protein